MAASEEISLQCQGKSIFGNQDLEVDDTELFDFNHNLRKEAHTDSIQVGIGMTHAVKEIGDFQSYYGIDGELSINSSREIQGKLSFEYHVVWHNKDPQFKFRKSVELKLIRKNNFFDGKSRAHFQKRIYLTEKDYEELGTYRSQLPVLHYYKEVLLEKAWYDISEENETKQVAIELPLIGWDIKCVAETIE